MLLRLFRVFAAAAGLAADVVLLPQATRMHGPQSSQPVLKGLDPSLDFKKLHVLCHSRAIGFCQEKNAFWTRKKENLFQEAQVSGAAAGFSSACIAAGSA
jgi:hypothetical protein